MTFEERVKEQLPTLFITLVSILIGLDLSDLVEQARSRMTLWPLDLPTVRTWFQLFSMGASTLAAWIVYSHIGMSRRRVPVLWDSLIAFVVPLGLLIANSFVGLRQIWPWFYVAGAYLVICVLTSAMNLRLAIAEPELAALKPMLRPQGHLGLLGGGAVFFGAAGLADQLGRLSMLGEVLVAASPIGMSLVICYLFIHEWRQAIAASPSA
jgi:hypothetical protein